MKWVFYIIVFMYMFYRAVYGLKNEIVINNEDNADGRGIFVEAGERTIKICKASGKNQKLEWIDPNGQVIPRLQSKRIFASQFFVQSPRAQSPSLLLNISKAEVHDSGVWTCRAGNMVHSISICVIESTDFEGTPTEVAADEGRSYTLSCQTSGEPEAVISWMRNGRVISEFDYEDTPKYRVMTKYNSQGIEGLLTIMSLTTEDSGVYTCQSTQETELAEQCRIVKTFNITLNINLTFTLEIIIVINIIVILYRPIIGGIGLLPLKVIAIIYSTYYEIILISTLQVTNAPSFGGKTKENVYGTESEILLLRCEADGYPQPTYQWSVIGSNDETVPIAESEIIEADNGSASVLSVKVSENTFNEKYVCQATNKLGEVDLVFNILVSVQPERPAKVELLSNLSSSKTLAFKISWDEEIQFDIRVIEVQSMPAALLPSKRAVAGPKETDWKRSRKYFASIGEGFVNSTIALVGGLEPSTEYWVRLRVKNDVGDSPWSSPVRAATMDEEYDDNDEEEEHTEEQNASDATEPASDVTEEESFITTEKQSTPSSDDSGRFYGLFFAVGVLIVAVGCTFIVRMV